MPLSNILRLFSAKTGLNPADTRQREVALRFINEAAYELYMQSDMAGSLMEQCFKVNGDQTISLPQYVGPVRALRELDSMIPWNLNQMRPRYNQSNWQDYWRNWRVRNTQALQKSITNTAPVAVSVPVADTGLIVSINGSTLTGSSVTEDITMSSTYISGVQDFVSIIGVTKNKVTMYDVSILDIDGNVLTVIPNSELAAVYQIIDVSTCPWLPQDGNQLDHYVEVLYKKALPYLSNDGDEFPAQGYDYIVANKSLQVWFQENGNAQEALAYDQLTTRSLARKHEEENRGTEDVMALVENPHDSLNPRIRGGRGSRYGSGYGGYRYGVM